MAVQIADLSEKSDAIMIYESECPIPILKESVLESGDAYFSIKINETEQYRFKQDAISIIPINHRSTLAASSSSKSLDDCDRPEFIDVNHLSLTSSPFAESIVISDDEDVVFVKEYKEKDNSQVVITKNSIIASDSSATIRRNPVRKARNSKGVKDLAGELYEEDFDILDQQLEDETKSKVAYNKKPIDNYKRWPVNVHDRPEYNSVTQKIEPLDYTLREIQKNNCTALKKPQPTQQVRKAKKKTYFPKRRHKENVRAEKKCPIGDLKKLVTTTTESLKMFVSNLKVQNNTEKYKFMLENQEVFCGFVRN